MDEDELKGGARQFAGKVEEGLGAASGDESLEARGQVHQAEGGARKLYGAAKDTADSAASAASAAFETMRDSVSGQWSHRTDDGLADDSYGEDGLVARGADFVRQQPLLALLGAATAGYALAFLFHRRGR